MIGEFTEKAKTYENIAKANGLELTKQLRSTITDYLTYEDQLCEKEIASKEKENNKYKYLRSQKDLQIHLNENGYGSFYFNFYDNIINKLDFKNITRLLYLCSYMDYNNRLVMKITEFKHIPMTNKDLIRILNLSEKEFYRTKKELVEQNILIEKEGVFYINESICKRGAIVDNKKDNKIRNFDNAIKELYRNSVPKEHKFLALIYKILPYINYNHNIVCKNPTEENKEFIEPFTIKEISEMFGYKNQTVFKNNLLKLKVNGEPVVILTFIANTSMILINPKVYYKGNEKNEVKNIEYMIDIATKITRLREVDTENDVETLNYMI